MVEIVGLRPPFSPSRETIIFGGNCHLEWTPQMIIIWKVMDPPNHFISNQIMDPPNDYYFENNGSPNHFISNQIMDPPNDYLTIMKWKSFEGSII